MEHLTILNFSTGEVHIYPIAEDTEIHVSDSELLKQLGFRESDCQWMFSGGEITLDNRIIK